MLRPATAEDVPVLVAIRSTAEVRRWWGVEEDFAAAVADDRYRQTSWPTARTRSRLPARRCDATLRARPGRHFHDDLLMDLPAEKFIRR